MHCGAGSGPVMPVKISYSDPTGAIEEVKQIAIEYSWDYVPSAVERNLGLYFQSGVFIEPNVFSEFGYVYNFRSQELSLNFNRGINGYVGTPSLMSTGVSGTTTVYFGMSSNKNLDGVDIFAGLTGGIDSFAEFDGSLSISKSYEDDLKTLAIDKISGRPITGYSAGISSGINLLSNGINAGGFIGLSKTNSYTIPNVPLPIGFLFMFFVR